MTASIEARHLGKRLGPVTAVEDVSFEVMSGRVTGFPGPNGAGKTTTLRMLLGLVAPARGTATIGGRPYRELCCPRQVGVALESSGAHPGRTARAHLRPRAMLAGVPPARAEQVLALTGLADAAERRAGGFSLGMRQRLGLAAALIGDPAVLILDEPANGLDPDGVRWLRKVLRRLAGEGRTVLVSSHLLAEAAQTIDEVTILNRGRLIAHAPLGEPTSRARPVIRVRTPRAEDLRSALAADGAQARIAEPGWVEVTGATPEQVGARAASLSIITVFAWAFLIEGALGALSGSIVPYLPFQAAASLAGATLPGGATPLPFAAAVTAGAAFLLAAAAARVTLPRDIT
jgi:ABC-2 type transport system ATP-binding protein